MKTVIALLVVLVASTALLLHHGSNGTASVTGTVVTEAAALPQQPARIIDGAINPELIPDRVAYSLMFRFIANRPKPEEKGRIRAYLRHIGLADGDIDGLIAAAEEFNQRVSPLDADAKQIKASNRGIVNPQVETHLRQLQGRKEAVVDYVVARLPLRISGDAISKLQRHVAEHVKRRVRFQPN